MSDDTPLNNSPFWKAYRKERVRLVKARKPDAKRTWRMELTSAEIVRCARVAALAAVPSQDSEQ